MNTQRFWPAVGLVLAGAVGCSLTSPSVENVPTGKSSFETPVGGAYSSGPGRAEEDAAAGGPNSPSPSNGAGTPRLVEESDIYKRVGNYLYVLNHYRGLQVIDLTDFDHPKVVGRAPIFGYPKDMYVRGNNAYVIVSDYYSYWRSEVADAATGSFHGSQVRVIDITNPKAPVQTTAVNISGDVTDSRIVGDVLYLVSAHHAWYDRFGSPDATSKTVILSVDISDPARVRAVETKEFPKSGWEQHLSVTPNTVYIASAGWDEQTNGYATGIRYVDISAPNGHIEIRGEAQVPGRVADRWSMDEYDGVLRVASGHSWGNGDVYLTTIGVSDPDNLTRLGGITLTIDERLTAARFDGPHGYLVTAKNIDPLFTFDLSDPANPVLLEELKMSGWLDFLVPMGDHLVALGHDTVDQPGGGTANSLAVSLIDVTPGKKPVLVSRVHVGEGWGWVPSSADDYAKIFKVLPQNNLVMLPFQSWSSADWRYVGGVQLIDYTPTGLTKRGLVDNAGWVERGIPENDTTILTLSDEVFQVVDITNRDAPGIRGRLQLSRNVQDFSPLPGGYAVQLVGDWYKGDTTLVVTPLDDPDSETPVAELHIPAPYGRLFVSGSFGYVVGVRSDLNNATQIQVVDFTDPTKPKLRGSTTLTSTIYPGYRYWYWGSGDEVQLVNGTLLALHKFNYEYSVWDGQGASSSNTIYLVDLSNPDAPVLASTTNIPDSSWAWGMGVSGNTLTLSHYRSVQRNNQWFAKYFLRRIDISNPRSPVVLPEVNIPGQFLAFGPAGTLYTLEYTWDATTYESHTYVHALRLFNHAAYLQGTLELPGYVNNVQVKGTTGYASNYVYGTTTWYSRSQLLVLDLATPTAPRLASTTDLPLEWGWLQKVVGARAFYSGGNGILTYDVSNPAKPAFEAFFRTQGWSNDLVVEGKKLYVPSGSYGVQVVELP